MYTVKEISKMTGKCEETIKRWIRKGLLIAETRNGDHGRGSTFYVSQFELEKFAEKYHKRVDYSHDPNASTKLIDRPDIFSLKIRLEEVNSIIKHFETEREIILSQLETLC